MKMTSFKTNFIFVLLCGALTFQNTSKSVPVLMKIEYHYVGGSPPTSGV